MFIIAVVLLICVGVAAAVGLGAFAWWVFFPRPLRRFSKAHESLYGLLAVAAFFGLEGIMLVGTERLLFFIPNDLRSALGWPLAMGIPAFFAYVLGQFGTTRRANEHLQVAVGVLEAKERLRNSSLDMLMCEAARIRRECDHLQNRRFPLGTNIPAGRPAKSHVSLADDIKHETLELLWPCLDDMLRAARYDEVRRRMERLYDLPMGRLVVEQEALRQRLNDLDAQCTKGPLSFADEAERLVLADVLERMDSHLRCRSQPDDAE